MRRSPLTLLASVMVAGLFVLIFTSFDSSGASSYSLGLASKSSKTTQTKVDDIKTEQSAAVVSESLVNGKPIMAKMGNQTIRAELGRSAWKVFHTILAQYPESPTKEERETLNAYIHLFSRVYPCRECAEHFQELLKQFPPQTSSQEKAALWGCHVHNQVNERLGKEIFDCAHLDDKYSCGCAEDEEEGEEGQKGAAASESAEKTGSESTETQKAAKELVIDVDEGLTSG